MDYDSAGSQFFIMHKDGDFLNGKYAAFGKVINGIEVVDKIAALSMFVESNEAINNISCIIVTFNNLLKNKSMVSLHHLKTTKISTN